MQNTNSPPYQCSLIPTREQEESSSESFEKSGVIKEVEINEEEHEEEPLTPPLRRSTRVQNLVDRYRPPNFYCNSSLSSTDDELGSYREALSSKESESWMKTMQEEMIALDKCDTWDLDNFSMEGIPLDASGYLRRNLE